ncbi:MAG: NAD(P)H-hydrate epimerase [Candidatus Omnitrophica bacterium CG_4_9_14_0_2_um_filter_42_8]|nr:MAG: NAD(P)H-hydrate epimerase [Candidatus Omnitrophica bacterium CG_4_9_14_0_2_um_filter_42_8]
MKIVSVKEMRELDRIAIEDNGIPSIALMENAGRAVSEIALAGLKNIKNKKAAVFCGSGNNGGDGFVTARYLFNKGINVSVYLIGKRANLKNDPKVNAEALDNIGVEIREISAPVSLDYGLIIDAVFGIGLNGVVKEPAKSIISDLNKKSAVVISVDVPSGLDADTGEILGVSVKAGITVTMQFPKQGFYKNKGLEYTGKIITVDIGITGK